MKLLFSEDGLLNSGDDAPDFLQLKTEKVEGGFPAQLFADGPTDRRGAAPHLFVTLLALARKEVVISIPYFVPNATVLDAICAAAIRGVDVTMIFPKRIESSDPVTIEDVESWRFTRRIWNNVVATVGPVL